MTNKTLKPGSYKARLQDGNFKLDQIQRFTNDGANNEGGGIFANTTTEVDISESTLNGDTAVNGDLALPKVLALADPGFPGLSRSVVLRTVARPAKTSGIKLVDEGNAAVELADFLATQRLI